MPNKLAYDAKAAAEWILTKGECPNCNELLIRIDGKVLCVKCKEVFEP